jgi:SAM-dependent methyltransferase
LDIGCGTGGFTLELAKHCNRVVGIDISKKQIQQAIYKTDASKQSNIEFKHANALNIATEINDKFDFAVFTFMLHEIDHKDRLALLHEISEITNSIIIVEFYIPQPKNIWGLINRSVEFFAGGDHFLNFLDFKRRGGIDNILHEAGLQIIDQKINRKKVFTIVEAKKIKKV